MAQKRYKPQEIESNHILNRDNKFFKKIVCEETLKAIRFGLNNDQQQVTIFKFTKDGVSYILEKNQWRTALMSVREYFESRERYEDCGICNELIERIDG